MKGLIVDDDLGIRRSVTRLIQQAFHVEMVEASDGTQALDILLHHDIGFVLLDLTMPIMGGLDTLRAIRRSPRLTELPVFMLSGQPSEAVVREAATLGVIDFLAKPFTADTFCERIAPLVKTLVARDGGACQPALSILPGQRLALIDSSRDVRMAARQVLSRIGYVEVFDNEFAALRHCVEHPPEFLFIGSTSDMSTIEDLIALVRQKRELRSTRLVPVVDAEKVAAVRDSDAYDAFVVRADTAKAFEDGLRDGFTADTLVRVLIHADSTWLHTEVLEAVRRALADAMQTGVTLQPDRREVAPARWIVAGTQFRSGSTAWAVRFQCPVATALQMASLTGGDDTDEVTDARATAAAVSAAEQIGLAFQVAAAERGLVSECTHLAPAMRTTPLANTRSGGAAAHWRFVTSDHFLGFVTVTPMWTHTVGTGRNWALSSQRAARMEMSISPSANTDRPPTSRPLDTETAALTTERAAPTVVRDANEVQGHTAVASVMSTPLPSAGGRGRLVQIWA